MIRTCFCSVLLASALALVGCREEGPTGKLGRELDKAGEKIDEAKEKIEDAVDD